MGLILALDTATHTGWAFRDKSGIKSGVEDFSIDSTRESPGMRWLRFSNWLKFMVPASGAKAVVYEQPHQRGGASTTVALGFTTHLMSVCAELGIEHAAVHSQTLKKWATGSGRADKEAMMAEASRRVGYAIKDDNEADAILLLLCYEETHFKT